MAQIGKTVPTSSTTTVVGGRLAAGARNVATVDRAPIEALNPKMGTLLDDGASLFHAYQRDEPPPERDERSDAHGPGLVRSTSQAFAAFFEFENSSEASGEGIRKGTVPVFTGVLSRAITTYETNARVISGTMVPRGATLSLNL
jgi:hypothetical protein